MPWRESGAAMASCDCAKERAVKDERVAIGSRRARLQRKCSWGVGLHCGTVCFLHRIECPDELLIHNQEYFAVILGSQVLLIRDVPIEVCLERLNFFRCHGGCLQHCSLLCLWAVTRRKGETFRSINYHNGNVNIHSPSLPLVYRRIPPHTLVKWKPMLISAKRRISFANCNM